MVAWDGALLRFPAGCSTWACSWCGPQKAKRKTAICAWAEPERFITLTQAPDQWQALRQRIRKLALRLRAENYSVEWAWTVERGKRTGMIHVHALQHGSYIPQRTLQAMWGHIVHVRRIDDVDAAATYTTKHAAARVVSYTFKEARSHLQEHLDLNGGRGVHLSRGYLRGLRSDDVWRILHPPSALRWVQVPATMADGEARALVSTVG